MTQPETIIRQSPTRLQSSHSELRLVVERIRLLARRRAAWLDYLLQEADSIPDPLDDRDLPERETAWRAEHTPEFNARLADLADSLERQRDSRLGLLGRIFGLSMLDAQLLQTCLALALDPSLGAIFAYLHGHANRPYLTEELAARLLSLGRCLVLPADSPLHIWRLVHTSDVAPGESAMLVCDRQVRDWLQDSHSLHPSLVGRAHLHPPNDPPGNWPVAHVVDFIERVNAGGSRDQTCVQLTGLPGSGRLTLAACVARQVGLPLLAIDVDAIQDADWEDVFVYAQRQAFLENWALAWHGESLHVRRWPRSVPAFHLQFVIVSPEQTIPPLSGLATTSVRMPSLPVDERRRLWQRYLPSAAAWPPGSLEELAARYQVTTGEIAAVARQGVAGPEEAAACVRARQRDRLGRLAQRLECPFTWEDLVVGALLREALEDFVFEARERALFWEQPNARRLFPHGQGLAALFSGAPGTGKTMAAQVIAASLGLDLFRVDLSSVVSKYVGETSQNLERILSRAEHMDIVLFFDEADALFGKRTEIKDAHDRFANTDTNYLLQAIESYSGIVLLASNKKANIDPAFIRRLRYVLEFPPPDEAQRLQIWRQVIAELAGSETAGRLEPNLHILAKEITITGAQIKYAILAALFVARRERQPIQMEHLLRGLKRELLKEGRSLSDREMEKLRV